MSQQVHDIMDDNDFENLLNEAQENASTGWEENFVSDLQEKYDDFGSSMFLSDLQHERLQRIANKR